MYKFKQKLLSIFKENKVVGLTIILSLILIISLFTYGKNKNNVFKDKYMNNIFIEENVSEIDTNDESKDEEQEEVLESVEGVKSNTINLNKNKIVAEIKGEVIKPDVYILNEGSIIRDLIEAAGGLTPEADISNINRAKELSNHELIIIKNINDEVSQEEVENEIQSIEADDGKININTADINKLKEIPGIGDVKANSIIMYRESNGNFKSIEDLKNVDGIGEKTFEKIKNNIKI
ncbi:MAG: helix-hairpin-helix domain-containing protein [Clostridium sp.]|uniref:helix-hairpin-helix domain-containing protein n=1 Tax=Clostridium sp. TaxID=1506 RepID=UPI002F941192